MSFAILQYPHEVLSILNANAGLVASRYGLVKIDSSSRVIGPVAFFRHAILKSIFPP